MIFTDIPRGATVFLDANTLIYHFIAHPIFGAACTDLLDEVEHQQVGGLTSSHVLSEVAHRLLTIEAQQTFNWPAAGVATRLKQHPTEVRQMSRYRQALDEIRLIGVQALPIDGGQVSQAADLTQQYGLLNNDALVVVVMRVHGLTHLASHDTDFDRVPGLMRFAPA